LQGKGVALIGIHTPETQTEQDNDLLRQALEKYALKFPVAVDKQKKMWQAWYNGIWPSVYIIDKHGRVRYWWYGELDWQGAGNQKVALRQIEQLLAEK
jgi:peroxiredoxin